MIENALILAAGYGKRMENLTQNTPKPLLVVWGKTLLDHILTKVVNAGIQRVMINVHYLAPQMKDYLLPWKERIADLILIEEDEILGTGGTITKACQFVEGQPFFVINGDVLWRERAGSALQAMASSWQQAHTGLLALVNRDKAWGYDGNGDFFLDDDQAIVPKRNKHQVAPYVYAGIQIVHPAYTDGRVAASLRLTAPYPVNQLWQPQIQKKELAGYVFPDPWYHVGTKKAYQAVGYV